MSWFTLLVIFLVGLGFYTVYNNIRVTENIYSLPQCHGFHVKEVVFILHGVFSNTHQMTALVKGLARSDRHVEALQRLPLFEDNLKSLDYQVHAAVNAINVAKDRIPVDRNVKYHIVGVNLGGVIALLAVQRLNFPVQSLVTVAAPVAGAVNAIMPIKALEFLTSYIMQYPTLVFPQAHILVRDLSLLNAWYETLDPRILTHVSKHNIYMKSDTRVRVDSSSLTVIEGSTDEETAKAIRHVSGLRWTTHEYAGFRERDIPAFCRHSLIHRQADLIALVAQCIELP